MSLAEKLREISATHKDKKELYGLIDELFELLCEQCRLSARHGSFSLIIKQTSNKPESYIYMYNHMNIDVKYFDSDTDQRYQTLLWGILDIHYKSNGQTEGILYPQHYPNSLMDIIVSLLRPKFEEEEMTITTDEQNDEGKYTYTISWEEQ
jgi:hypothetical protein